jgi:hypothetical protein
MPQFGIFPVENRRALVILVALSVLLGGLMNRNLTAGPSGWLQRGSWCEGRSFRYGYPLTGIASFNSWSYDVPYGHSCHCSPYWLDRPFCGWEGRSWMIFSPCFADARLLFGPRLWFTYPGNPGGWGDRALPRAEVAPDPLPAPAQPRDGKPLRGDARKLACRFIEFGDKQFRNRKYHQALQRYKKSAGVKRDVATAFFRQALAHFALGKYGRATTAIKRGLVIAPDWPQTDLRLDDLYVDANEQRAHRKQLIDWLAEHPLDADAHFMVGVISHFTGQEQLAAAAIVRTIELSGISDHATAFLPRPEPEEAAEPGPIANP